MNIPHLRIKWKNINNEYIIQRNNYAAQSEVLSKVNRNLCADFLILFMYIQVSVAQFLPTRLSQIWYLE